MNFHSDKWIMDNVKEHYEEAKTLIDENRIVGIFVQGSQNYCLDYDGSDIDTKLIVLPSFKDIVLNKKPISTTHIRANNEHIDIKDIRLMFQNFKKQNINFLEILFTRYKIINPFFKDVFQPVIDTREKIAHYNNYVALNCMAGMSMEKYAAMEHPYPTLMDKIEKYGYDPKQLHHIMRMNDFMKRYINRESYEDCLIPTHTNLLVKVKQTPPLYKLEEARGIAQRLNEENYLLKSKYMDTHELKIDYEVEDILEDTLVNIFKKSLRGEIM